MTEIEGRGVVEVDCTIRFKEPEIEALAAVATSGDDSFIKALYHTMGKALVRPHERALRTFFKAVRIQMPPILERARKARAEFERNGK